jgi:hypothetical protein
MFALSTSGRSTSASSGVITYCSDAAGTLAGGGFLLGVVAFLAGLPSSVFWTAFFMLSSFLNGDDGEVNSVLPKPRREVTV